MIGGSPKGRRRTTSHLLPQQFGLGYQFAAAGSRASIARRKEAGAGHELPTDWFTEDVHP